MPPAAVPDLAATLRTGPFHEALRVAITTRGLSLHRLRHHLSRQGLDVGITTLSYWQQGRRRPERPDSLRAVAALEEILGLPEHSLTTLLGPQRPRGRAAGMPPGSVGYPVILEPAPVMARILDELDSVEVDRRLHVVSQYEHFEVGPDRGGRRRETLQVVKAHQDSADRLLMFYRGDVGCDVERMSVRALENCRVGRLRRDAGAGLMVAEFLLDHALRVDETYILRYELLDHGGQECTFYERGFRFPSGHYVLQVRFDPRALPVRCRKFARRTVASPDQSVTDLTLNAYRTVHLAAGDVQPGLLGIRWDWN